jgi:catechol 2,3-dioxygenase-like lactoylglutathione lyase family enzyme
MSNSPTLRRSSRSPFTATRQIEPTVGKGAYEGQKVTWARLNELSRVSENSQVPLLVGVHHVTVPASDPLAASDWYVRVFDFAELLVEERENEVTAVLLQHPCGARLLLRRTDEPAAALRGYPLFGLSVANHDELLRWVEHLATFDIEYSDVHEAHLGWAVIVTGPDMVRIQLHTDEGPSGEGE